MDFGERRGPGSAPRVEIDDFGFNDYLVDHLPDGQALFQPAQVARVRADGGVFRHEQRTTVLIGFASATLAVRAAS